MFQNFAKQTKKRKEKIGFKFCTQISKTIIPISNWYSHRSENRKISEFIIQHLTKNINDTAFVYFH